MFAAILAFSDRIMIQANHPQFSCTSEMSLTIYGIFFSGPLMHTDTPSLPLYLTCLAFSALVASCVFGYSLELDQADNMNFVLNYFWHSGYVLKLLI